MIIKTAIALFLTASLAGGAVYYGTQGDTNQNGEVALGEHPHKKIEEEDDTETMSSGEQTISSSDQSTIDQLLKRNQAEETAEPEMAEEGPEPSSDTVTETTTITETVTEITDSGADEEREYSVEAQPLDVYDYAIEQAEQIETLELRDQAYLDIVDYACKHKNFEKAKATLGVMNKAQMRDKARGRIAISMAQQGLSSDAFNEIDGVETEGLRDTMRLQVIQAMIQK